MNKKSKAIATAVFYLLGMVLIGLMLISWNESEIPPAAEPLGEMADSLKAAEEAIPLPMNDVEPQNFAQPTVKSDSAE